MAPDFTPGGGLHPSDLAPGLFTALLDNGMRVIIKEDRRRDVAICNVWVGAGSNREPEALRGWSHGIEHLLFKGTGKRGEGDFAREVAEAGGSTNAGTGYETTNYHITLPAENLPVAVDILGDALFHSAFEPGALDAEREVLVHENHMYDDVPFGYGVTWRWGMELAFDRSPYAHPIGGQDENLRERSRDQILAYWRSAYRPDNVIVVLVGAFAADEAFGLVKEKFGTVPPYEGPGDPATDIVAAPPVEGRHDGPRWRLERGDIAKCYAKLIFPAPGEHEDRRQIMSVIHKILADGRSCRMHRQVQEESKLVDDFVVMTEAGPREGIAIVDLETDVQRLPAAIKAVCSVLEDLKRTGGTPEELDRARVRTLRGHLFGNETVQGQAHNLGHHAMLGDLPGAFEYPGRVASVTAADVAAIAAEVFDRHQLSVIAYLPEHAAAGDLPASGRDLEELLRGVLSTGVAHPSPAGPAGAPGPTRHATTGGRAEPFRLTALPGGGEICWRIDRTVPVLAMTLTTLGGACSESAASAGLAALTSSVQIKGAGGRTAAALHGLLEGEGASISPRTERDFSGLGLSAMSDRLDRPLDLLADIIHTPDFAPDEIEQERRLALEELASLEDNPLQLGVTRLREMLYGDHPYGRLLPGTPESLPGLTRELILAAHAGAWIQGNIQVCLSGDFDPDLLLPLLQDILAALPAGPRTIPVVSPARKPSGAEIQRLQRRINQCVLLFGWPGPRHPDENLAPRLVLKEVLNGQSGRLFEELRNKRSLCYNTGVMTTAGFGQGMMLGYVLTAPESEQEARTAMLAELSRITVEPVGAVELEMARAKLIGNLLIGHQSNSAMVARAARNRVYGREAEDLVRLVAEIRAVSAGDVTTLAGELITPDRRCEVVVSPAG